MHAYDIMLSQEGDSTGDLMHSDFVNGWPEASFPEWLGTCAENEGCAAHPVFPNNINFAPSSLTFRKPVPLANTEGIQNP